MATFRELPISEPVLRAIDGLGFTEPSPIQAETLPILLGEPTDFLGLAATGTGKTAAFSIPALERIQSGKMAAQVLIMCPTRELALQVAGQVDILGKYKHMKAVAIYGGAPYGEQIRGIKSGAQVIVGTPGRMIDHLERGTLKLDDVRTVILDEADEMISMGFKEDIEKILESTNREESKIWLFSATMSPEVRRVADKFLRDPKQVQVNRTEMLSSTVEQIYYMVRESNKPEVLAKLIDAADGFYGVVFCQTKALVQDLTTYLNERGFRTDCLHGDKSQDARERTMKAFRDRAVTVLVCTDVAARGLDVKDVTHVVNYSLPRELDNYVHRIGRTARSGKSGVAMSLVTPSHRRLLTAIERLTRSKMKEGTIPSRRDVGAKKVAEIFAKLQTQEYFERPMDVMSDETKELLANMTPQEIAGRFLAMMMPEVFADDHRLQMRDSRNHDQGPRSDRGDRREGGDRFDRGGDHFKRHEGGDRSERRFDRKDRDGGFDRFEKRGFDRKDRDGGFEKRGFEKRSFEKNDGDVGFDDTFRAPRKFNRRDEGGSFESKRPFKKEFDRDSFMREFEGEDERPKRRSNWGSEGVAASPGEPRKESYFERRDRERSAKTGEGAPKKRFVRKNEGDSSGPRKAYNRRERF